MEKQRNRQNTCNLPAARIRSPKQHPSVVRFMAEQIESLTDCNRLGTAINYRTALESLCGFLKGDDLPFRKLTAPFVERYSEYLQHKGLVKNSISFHMRILRAVYNKAARHGLTEQTYPFQNVYTGVDRTRKRAVDPGILARLIDLELSRHAPLALTRDLFLFSLYTRGMSFVDMAFLTRDNLIDGTIRYIRRKTKQPLCIRIEPCIRQLIDRYADADRRYLFPILKSEDAAEAYAQYRISMTYYNRQLKRLSQMLGIQQGLTFYAARHSWATLARDNNVPVSVISAGMGHTSERTTRIYLTTLENTLIDNANRLILNTLNGSHAQESACGPQPR